MEKIFIKSDCFNLYNTFYNGQCFRWEQIDKDLFQGIAFNKPLRLEQRNDGVILNCAEEDVDLWKKYFDLDTDYKSIENLYLSDAILEPCVRAGSGMRILRQDIWEVLISFIISQNNNIARIKKIIAGICKKCGKQMHAYEDVFYAFPTASELASLDIPTLQELGLGYRAQYVFDCAKLISRDDAFISNLSELDYENARQMLLSLKGIGPKVANCILLFGLRHFSAFPVDTWIHKAMVELYPNCGNNKNAIEKFAVEKFGDNAGIAQQYIFYAARQGSLKIK